MKTVFFDVQPYEEEFLKKAVKDKFEAIFISSPINENFMVDEKINDAEIISVFITSTLSENVLKKFPKLKFILTRSVGFSHIDMKYCKEHEIYAFNTPHYGDYTVAEYTFALLLYTIRKIKKAQKDIQIDNIIMNDYIGVELFNKTIGVIGAGSIGRKVLDIAKGFKMNTLAYDLYQNGDYNYCSLDELIQKSDIISINSPLTTQTYHLINKDTIAKMKDGVIIVNVARGEIIDTQALYEALLSKKVAYAALDVIECEEILCTENQKCKDLQNIKDFCLEKFYINQKLLKLPNVTITPHMAYNTKEAIERILFMTEENLMSCLNFNPKTGAKNVILL